jgi:uncharacterized small protein (DUF1192 family)
MVEEADMALMDEDERPKPVPHRVGEDLATLSEAELDERIALLKSEIERLQAALDAKRASRAAAASVFKS